MRTVISGVVTARRFYGRRQRSHSESELLGRICRLETHAPAVANAVLACQRAHVLAHRLDLAARQIGAGAVQLLVLRQQFGPVPLERGEEVLARALPEIQEVRS